MICCPRPSRVFGSERHILLLSNTTNHTPLENDPMITKVLEDHHLSKQIEEFLPEDARFPLTEAFEFLLGLHPPSGMLREYAKETVRKLATAGNVILMGRGAQ